VSIVRKTILAVALASLAVACGGKNKAADSTMDNSGGSDMGGTDDGMGGDAYGGATDPCAGAEGMDPCGGGE
jgi:hypothetical protein